MKQQQKSRPRPLVVATAHTAKGLGAARHTRGVDFVEVRLDLLRRRRGLLDRELPGAALPWLLTARHPAEGGAPGVSAGERRALLERYLPCAAAIDVELRSVAAMGGILERARTKRVPRVVSFHDFTGTPATGPLRKVIRRAASAGADIVKIATLLRGPGDLVTLLRLQDSATVPLATMGMGPLGKVSRLVLAAAGSRLNYGYLDRPQVAGQWPAAELAQRLREVVP